MNSKLGSLLSELADEADLGLEALSELIPDFGLGNGDELANILCGGPAKVHHDIGVNVRDLGIAVTKAFQSDLVDKAAGADTLDFLEDRAGAGMVLEPWVLAASPAEILLHDAMHYRRIAGLELKRHRQSDVALLVQGAGVISELHVVAIDRPPLPVMGKQLGRFEHLGDEHRSFPGGSGREEVEILPHRSADRAWYPDIVLEPGEAALDGLRDEFCHHRSTFHPELPSVEKLQVIGDVPDDETAESLVSDEDVCAESEDEVLDSQLASRRNRPCQIVGRCCIVKEIRWTTNPECGVLSKRLISLEPLGVQTSC